jgi:hypothetical protein
MKNLQLLIISCYSYRDCDTSWIVILLTSILRSRPNKGCGRFLDFSDFYISSGQCLRLYLVYIFYLVFGQVSRLLPPIGWIKLQILLCYVTIVYLRIHSSYNQLTSIHFHFIRLPYISVYHNKKIFDNFFSTSQSNDA